LARWSLVLAERGTQESGGSAWSVPVLAERGTQENENGCYPVAKINNMGSGSNKFCLAVLVRRAHDGTDPGCSWCEWTSKLGRPFKTPIETNRATLGERRVRR